MDDRRFSFLSRLTALFCTAALLAQMPACVAEGQPSSSDSSSAEDGSTFRAEVAIAARQLNSPEYTDTAAYSNYYEQLSAEGKLVADQHFSTTNFPDPQSLASQFVEEFDEDLRAGAFSPHISGPIDPTAGPRGSFRVGRNGEAKYSIPLQILPGRDGLSPSISLNYDSSQRTDGELGIGWSLTLPSTIHQCHAWASWPFPATEEMQDAMATVSEAKTRLCYGGKPLVAVNGTAKEPGLASNFIRNWGAEFRTVPDTGVKIVRGEKSAGDVDPDYDPGFTVYQPNGTIHFLDKSAHAGDMMAEAWWSVYKVVDRRFGERLDGGTGERPQGHELLYTWREESRMPKSIRYLDGKREIDFHYGLPHTNSRYVRGLGGEEKIHDVLTKIRVISEGKMQWAYKLSYYETSAEATGRVHLDSIRKCVPDGGTSGEICTPVTTFKYSDLAPGAPKFVDEENSTISLESLVDSAELDADGNFEDDREQVSNITVADLNGDGRDDVVWRDRDELKYSLAQTAADAIDGVPSADVRANAARSKCAG